jgi:hypothetical protein
MEIARFWGSLKMSQGGLNMTSSALFILVLVSLIILVAGESTNGLVERQSLAISGFWFQTNQHLFASISHQEVLKVAAR